MVFKKGVKFSLISSGLFSTCSQPTLTMNRRSDPRNCRYTISHSTPEVIPQLLYVVVPIPLPISAILILVIGTPAPIWQVHNAY